MSESEKISIGDVMDVKDTHLNIDGHVVLSEIIIKHLDKIKDVKEYVKNRDREKILLEKNIKKQKMLIEKMEEERLLEEKKIREEILKTKKLF